MKIDLHSHSTYSDGTLDPEEVVARAARCSITHLALSDHDTTEGLESARKKSSELGLTLIPAIEINTQETHGAVHILGYFLDEQNENLQKKLQYHREIREIRSQKMIDRLHQMGIKIAMEDFSKRKAGAAIGRPHLADRLKELGVVFSRQEAFDKYLAKGRPAYVFYEGPTPQSAIDIILEAKGIPVLAHPGFLVRNDAIVSLVQQGLQGIEVYYPSHSAEQMRNFLELAKRHNLVPTGGSDDHGPGSGHERLGEIPVPEETVELLLAKKVKLFG